MADDEPLTFRAGVVGWVTGCAAATIGFLVLVAGLSYGDPTNTMLIFIALAYSVPLLIGMMLVTALPFALFIRFIGRPQIDGLIPFIFFSVAFGALAGSYFDFQAPALCLIGALAGSVAWISVRSVVTNL